MLSWGFCSDPILSKQRIKRMHETISNVSDVFCGPLLNYGHLKMSGKEQTKSNGEKGGVLDSVKEAGKDISNEISKKTGGSQVCSIVRQLA